MRQLKNFSISFYKLLLEEVPVGEALMKSRNLIYAKKLKTFLYEDTQKEISYENRSWGSPKLFGEVQLSLVQRQSKPMQIRYPLLSEIEELASVLFRAFYKDFSYLYREDYEFGRKLFQKFYKKVTNEKDLRNFLVATVNTQIVAAVHLDFENPKPISFFAYFLKMNLHFIRSFTRLGVRRAFRIMLGMNWFFFEDFNTNSCYIKLLGVLPEYQNCKIGTQMLQLIERITYYKHLVSMTLDVTIEDLPARHLYNKMGFIQTRCFQNSFMKYLNGIEGAISMEKKLTYENRR